MDLAEKQSVFGLVIFHTLAMILVNASQTLIHQPGNGPSAWVEMQVLMLPRLPLKYQVLIEFFIIILGLIT